VKYTWDVDLALQKATHSSGLEIIFTGWPETTTFQGSPKLIPSTLSALELSTLIRTGFEAYRKTCATQPRYKTATAIMLD